MELRDIIVTPLLLFCIYLVAYLVRSGVTDDVTRSYFIPALTVRIIGALAVGFIYQFYYNGGDTYSYHTHGSRHLWNAFWDSPDKAWRLFFFEPGNVTSIYSYTSKIAFITDPSSYVIVRIAFLLDLLTFSSYSGTAVLFAVIGFVGSWLFFLSFYKQYPRLHRGFAIASLFIPSVVFWGSGLLKDTITLACLGACVYCVHKIFIQRSVSFAAVVLLAVSFFLLYKIKIYIILTFLPAAIIWISLSNLKLIRSSLMRVLLVPAVAISVPLLAYWSIDFAGRDNSKYSLSKIGETAQITAYDIRYYTGRDAGSGYSLGELDGSITSMIALAPQAVNVTLFRPYLWEVRNPLMLLSAMESLAFLTFVVFALLRLRMFALAALKQPDVIFLFVFSITFAFAVGVATFNFGTLVRYKIPMLPFFVTGLILLWHYANSERKLAALDSTE